MLVYDITNEKSFDNIRNWIRNIEEVRALTHHLTSPRRHALPDDRSGGIHRKVIDLMAG